MNNPDLTRLSTTATPSITSRKRCRSEGGDKIRFVCDGEDGVMQGTTPLPARASARATAETVRLTPHTERLLELIENGTLEHAKLAAKQLSDITAPPQSWSSGLAAGNGVGALVLWEIIGRLAQFLLSMSENFTNEKKQSSWQTRYNASLAIEGVARHLPVEDQVRFLQQNPAPHAQHDCARAYETLRDSTGDRATVSVQRESDSLWLLVDDLTDENLETILENGRTLWARSEEYGTQESRALRLLQETDCRYCHQQNHAACYRENTLDSRRRLKQPLNKDCRMQGKQFSFLQQRMHLQRQLLSQKLGLNSHLFQELLSYVDLRACQAEVSDGWGIADRDLPNVAMREERICVLTENGRSSAAVQNRQQHVSRIILENCNENERREVATNKKFQTEPSLRSLLVLEMKQQQQEHTLQLNEAGQIQSRAPEIGAAFSAVISHANPQSLLATELIYRMFDPSWEVRHGALLGVSALLRAWWKNSNCDNLAEGSTLHPFGRWPQDIMARCLCCLILDRFEDYSGATAPSSFPWASNDNINIDVAVRVGGVTAPVREMAGQVLASVYMLAPKFEQQVVLSVLCDSLLLNRKLQDDRLDDKDDSAAFSTDETYWPWEVRHGAMIALKYIVGMTGNLLSRNGVNDLDLRAQTLFRVVRVACNCLADESDDIRSVAATVVSQVLSIDMKLTCSEKTSRTHRQISELFCGAKLPILKSLQRDGSGMSSCMVDLVALLNALLCQDRASGLFRAGDQHASFESFRLQSEVIKALDKDSCIPSNQGQSHVVVFSNSSFCLPRTLNRMIDLFITCEYPSAQQCMLRAIGAIASRAVSTVTGVGNCDISGSSPLSFPKITALLSSVTQYPDYESLKTALCRAIRCVYDSWFCYESPYGDLAEEGLSKEISMLGHADSNSATNAIGIIRDRTWTQLSLAAAKIFCLPNSVYVADGYCLTALFAQLVRRYFGIGDRKEARPQRIDNFATSQIPLSLKSWKLQRHLDSARAISEFVVAGALSATNSNLTMNVLDFSFRTCFESPRCWQCQAACLLFAELRNRLAGDNLSMEIASQLKQVTESWQDKVYNKLRLKGRAGIKLIDVNLPTKFISLFEESFKNGLNNVIRKGANSQVEAETVLRLWKESVREYGAAGHKCHEDAGRVTSPMVTPSWMRLRVSLSFAIVAGGVCTWPSKLSPLVRSLVTSLKNERDEACQNLTAFTLSILLDKLASNEKYMFGRDLFAPSVVKQGSNSSFECLSHRRSSSFERTRKKVLESLCDIIAEGKSPSWGTGRKVIALFVRRYIDDGGTLESGFAPVWYRLHKLCTLGVDAMASCCSAERESEFVAALSILETLCRALVCGSEATWRATTVFFEPVALLFHLSSSCRIREKACDVLMSLCRIDVDVVIKKALPLLIEFMQDQDCEQHRVRACCMLRRLTSVIRTADLCRFLQTLLPLVMSMMTDSNEKCAKTAANIFSSLVRAAPLVPKIGTSGPTTKVINNLIHGDPLPPCPMPLSIQAALSQSGTVLRHYQAEGLAWLRFLQSMRLNGALCDAMGLGKTLQALLAVAFEYCSFNQTASKQSACEHQISLVLCPSTLVGHWMKEIDRFFPNQCIFRPLILTGPVTRRRLLWSRKRDSYNLVITSYASVRNDVDMLDATQWTFCILDEGHLLKNPKTVTSRALRRIRSRHRLILTGTPIQNNVNELWAVFDFLMPNFLGSASAFAKEFAQPITRSQQTGATAEEIYLGVEKLKLLHQQVLPFILRREKHHVLKELPPKTITTIPCDMSPLQLQIYKDFCTNAQGKKCLVVLQEALGGARDTRQPRVEADILKSLLFLRLLCTHPTLAIANPGSKDWLDESRHSHIEEADNRFYGIQHSGKLLALSQLLSTCGIASAVLGADNDSSLLYCTNAERCEGANNDSSSSWNDASAASRTGRLDGNEASKCLIFAQFTQSLDLVEDMLLKKCMPPVNYLRLDGRVPQGRRSNLVEAFNRDESVRLMLLTTRVGGLGLNLAAADTVIFLEHDWNPHVDLQAMDRAHRLGQRNTVNVYKLIVSDSIEEKVMEYQEKKLATAKTIVNSDNSTMFSMGTDRLLDIFAFRSEASSNISRQHGKAFPKDKGGASLDCSVKGYAEDYLSLSVESFVRGFD